VQLAHHHSLLTSPQKNVFDLGAQYKRFVRQIGLDQALEKIPILEIEPLIYKYANRLEFGQATRQVANDAAAILARMDRDWMVTGRQPPALCGAALILAARMNNFRRSVREVVYIVKAGDSTIIKRLEEFRRTKAGNLTVDQFRKYGKRLKSDGELPPIVKLQKEQELKKAREAAEAAGVDMDEEEQDTNMESPTHRDQDGFVLPGVPASATATTQAKRRRGRPRNDEVAAPLPTPPSSNPNSQNMLTPGTLATLPIVIPESSLPTENADSGDTPAPGQKRKRGRKKQPEVPRLVITEDDLFEETELERAIEQVVQEHDQEEAFELSLVRARAMANTEVQRERKVKDRVRPEGTTPRVSSQRVDAIEQPSAAGNDEDTVASTDSPEETRGQSSGMSEQQPSAEPVVVENKSHDWLDNVSIHSSEFEDDPDITTSLLSVHEIAIKERIWVSNNHDWLRRQTELQLARELEAAKLEALTAEERQAMEQAKIDKRNKRGARADELERMRQGIETAADATMMMLHKTGSLGRKVFSKHVDYGVLNRAYAPSSASAASSRAGSAIPGGSSRQGSAVPQMSSRAGSVTSEGRANSVGTPLSIEEQIAHISDRRKNRRERKAAAGQVAETDQVEKPLEADDVEQEDEEEEEEQDVDGFQEEYEEEEYEEDEVDYDTLALSNQVPGEDEEEYDDDE
jgi:transcription factor IIIB subunit 2